MSKQSLRPSPGLIVALIALSVALAGTAVALPGSNTVNSGDIQNGAVKRKDQAENQRTEWALIDLSDSQIIRQSGGISLTSAGESFAYVDFGHSVASRPIAATMQWSGSGVVRAVLCGESGSEEDTTCGAVGSNNHRHVYVDVTPDSTDDEVYLTVLPK